MLTLVQKGFYLVPCLPYFAIGFSILIAPFVINLLNRINNFRIIYFTSILLLISILTFTAFQIGKTGRDKDILSDVYIIGNIIPQHSTILVPRKVWDNWSLQCYFARYFYNSLDPDHTYNYFLKEKSDKCDTLIHYNKVDLPTKTFDLYKK